jgi:hypothetical protein
VLVVSDSGSRESKIATTDSLMYKTRLCGAAYSAMYKGSAVILLWLTSSDLQIDSVNGVLSQLPQSFDDDDESTSLYQYH